MSLRSGRRVLTSTTTGVTMFLFSALLLHQSAHADDPPQVVVDPEAATCPGELTARLLDELRLRTTSELVSTPVRTASNGSQALKLDAVDETWCKVHLEETDHSRAMVVPRDADALELSSVATRLAWIIDGIDGRQSSSHLALDDEMQAAGRRAVATQAAGSAGDRVVAAASQQITSVAAATPTASPADAPTTSPTTDPRFSFEMVGGATWTPSARATLPLARGWASWQPWSNVRFGLIGRLPVGAIQSSHGDIHHSYRSWSVDLTAGYVHSFGGGWTIGLDGGVRKTFARLSATETYRETSSEPNANTPNTTESTPDASRNVSDDVRQEPLDETPGRITSDPQSTTRDALSAWSAVTYASVSYPLMQLVALRLDTGVAVSLTDRVVRDDQQILLDLGRLELDMVLGLELRF